MLSTICKKVDAQTNCGKQYASEYMDITRCIEQEAWIEKPRIKYIDKYDLLNCITEDNVHGSIRLEEYV